MNNILEGKICKKCNTFKNFNDFHKNNRKNSKDGHSYLKKKN